MKAQIIEKNGKPEYAVIPYEDYLRMLAQIEDKVDAQAVAEFHENYVAGREQLVPAEILRRELEGESPIKLWREHRGLIQQELADRVGISKPYLSQIESGKRQESWYQNFGQCIKVDSHALTKERFQ
ncbi:helix-turn-helix domain-containing protein [Geoalkalibacter halelectricus]|uniref:helix-turn-helix domain-containing protein n=1 Tax=Geoalkalibacter halelectricus TaxID=2847045 RepID=UPI00266F495D|nr:helix-turn-helix transcriptional regulator [Geoalkalibacter halelectricus]MDO3379739.1 helix-turn-helix domain-containing protein [Geoalkalibacter halelectricus]